MKNPKWTEKELVLALDLYMKIPKASISAKSEAVIELSGLLNRLHSAEKLNAETYRNANGTALKLHNFARFDPASTAKGMSHGGKQEEVVWKRFNTDREALRRAAMEIRNSIAG
jgi:5-methylcytosine-specific restriction protein A